MSLCTGASIGSEIVPRDYGTGLVKYLGTTRSQKLQLQHLLGPTEPTCIEKMMRCLTFPSTIFYSQSRIQVALVLYGKGAAPGNILPSPVLVVLVVLELSIAARPNSLRLDAVLEAEHGRRMNGEENWFHPWYKYNGQRSWGMII